MIVFQKPKALTDASFHYCPGCTHGIVHRLVAQAIDELGIEGITVGVAPVGCAVMAYDYFSCDMTEAAHGRAPAVATGLKRANPKNIVFTYQGDGDLASIGTAETVHAAARNENITIIFINNAIYGMTGGQMAPTSLVGQVTQTSPYGRDASLCGYPVKICEMLSELEGPEYLERVAVNSVKNVNVAYKAIKKAFQNQIEGKGFSLVEVLSACPTNWGKTPSEALKWIESAMIPYYPLGVYKDRSAGNLGGFGGKNTDNAGSLNAESCCGHGHVHGHGFDGKCCSQGAAEKNSADNNGFGGECRHAEDRHSCCGHGANSGMCHKKEGV